MASDRTDDAECGQILQQPATTVNLVLLAQHSRRSRSYRCPTTNVADEQDLVFLESHVSATQISTHEQRINCKYREQGGRLLRHIDSRGLGPGQPHAGPMVGLLAEPGVLDGPSEPLDRRVQLPGRGHAEKELDVGILPRSRQLELQLSPDVLVEAAKVVAVPETGTTRASVKAPLRKSQGDCAVDHLSTSSAEDGTSPLSLALVCAWWRRPLSRYVLNHSRKCLFGSDCSDSVSER